MFKILHIALDDKFFDEVYATFEKDKRLSNEALLLVSQKDYVIQRIKSVEKVRVMWDKKLIVKTLLGGDYDAIFFHSLNSERWWLFDYIPNDKAVIWWAFGFDLYYGNRGLLPLLNFELFKDRTRYLIQSNKGLVSRLQLFLDRFFVWKHDLKKQQIKVLRRIDYFVPVLPLELHLMTENHIEFHAKEFYFKNVPINYGYNQKNPFGDIIIGNSATYSNNHLDILDIINRSGVRERKLVVPLSYGIRKYASKLKHDLISQNNQVIILHKMIPLNDYQKILDSCSYAIYGVIRQQATGNIYYCLLNGIKVFLYKESIVYRSLKQLGFTVYAIEDIEQNSFQSTLSLEETKKNVEAYRKQIEREYNIYENTIIEFANKSIGFTH